MSQQQHKNKITVFLSYIFAEWALDEVVSFDAETNKNALFFKAYKKLAGKQQYL